MAILDRLLSRKPKHGYALSEETAVSTATAVKKASNTRKFLTKLFATAIILASVAGIGTSLATIEEQAPVSAVAVAEECAWWNVWCHGSNVVGAVVDWTSNAIEEGFGWVGSVVSQAVVAGVNQLLVSWLCDNNEIDPKSPGKTIRIGNVGEIQAALGGKTGSSNGSAGMFNFIPANNLPTTADFYTARGGTGLPIPWNIAWQGDSITGEGKHLTGYEKYGVWNPSYDTWSPAYASYADAAVVYLPAGEYKHSHVGTTLTLTNGDFTRVVPGDGIFMTTNPLDCVNLSGISAMLLNGLTLIPRLGMLIAIETYGMAISGSASSNSSGFSIFGWVSSLIEDVITKPGGLRDAIFFPFLLPMILLGTVYLAWVGLIQRKASKAVASITWMIGGTTIAVVTMMNPLLIPVASDYVVSNVSLAFSSAVNSSTPSSALCELPPSYEVDTGNTEYDRYILETKCIIWKVAIYDTWVSGQFGAVDTLANLNASAETTTLSGVKKTISPQGQVVYLGSANKIAPEDLDWGMVHLDRQVTLQKINMTDIAYVQLSGNGIIPASAPRVNPPAGSQIIPDWTADPNSIDTPIMNPSWGWAGWNAIASALMMIIYSGPMMILIIYFAFLMLIYQLSLLGLMLAGPVLFVLAVLPSFGQRVAAQFFSNLVSLTLKRIMTSVALALYLFFIAHTTSASNSGSIDLLGVALLIIVITGMILGLRSRLISMTAPSVNPGTNGLTFRGAGNQNEQSGSSFDNMVRMGGAAVAGSILARTTHGRKPNRVAPKKKSKNRTVPPEDNQPNNESEPGGGGGGPNDGGGGPNDGGGPNNSDTPEPKRKRRTKPKNFN